MPGKRTRETRAERQSHTRAELLDAAAEVFARRGYEGASIEEIAEHAGYSHGAVYSNFTGKAELFLTVFEDYMARRARELADAQAALGDGAPIEARARSLADQWMERFGADRQSFVLQMEFLVHAARDPELAGRLGARSSALREAVARYISGYQAEAGSQLPLSAEDLAMVLRALGIGLAVEALVSPASVRPDLFGDFVQIIVELFLQPRAGRKSDGADQSSSER